MNDEIFNNPARGAIRWFLWLATAFAAVGVTPLFLHLTLGDRWAPSPGASQGWLILTLVMAPLTIAMLLSHC